MKYKLTITMPLAFAFALLGAEVRTAPPHEQEGLTLQIRLDRKQYTPDDTMMVLAEFGNDPPAEVQLAGNSGGSLYFHLVLESKAGKGNVICLPLWELQFEEWGDKIGDPKLWLGKVGTKLTHQLAVHLPRLRGLSEGEYKLRIGYTLSAEQLKPLVDTAIGGKISVSDLLTERLKGAFGGAVLSEPVAITIGPKLKK